MPDIAFVNGHFMPLADATVSIEDRGYQFGDGVYEVIRTYRAEPFQLDSHLMRLERSAKAVDLALPYQPSEWRGYIKEAIRLAAYPEAKVYIQVTRGAAPRDHHVPRDLRATVVMTVREMVALAPVHRQQGVTVITVEDLRWGRCDIKSINLLPNVLARQHARAADAFEAIFVRDGEVSEGAAANVVIVRSGVLATPPEGPRILAGVTRAVVLELARSLDLPVEERRVSLEELLAADEVFLTGTTVEILPVIRVDGHTVGAGVPGEVTRLLVSHFLRLVA